MESTKPRIGSSQSTKLQSISQQQDFQYYAGRVLQAFEADELYVRSPNLSNDQVTPGIEREFSYIQREEHIPCSAVHVVKGGRSSFFVSDAGGTGIVMVNPSVLYAHKKDVSTPAYPREKGTPDVIAYLDRLSMVHRSDSRDGSAAKIREMAQRSYSHYFSWTSGHLRPHGQFSQRKYLGTGQYYQSRPVLNETVLECIRTQDLAGIVDDGEKIISTKADNYSTLVDMLCLRKKIAVHFPDLPLLPLVFFDTESNHLRTVLFPESLGYTDDAIINRLKNLRAYITSCELDTDHLGELMVKLPPKRMIQRLMTIDLPTLSPSQVEAKMLVLRSGQNNYWHNPDIQLPCISEFSALAGRGVDFRSNIQVKTLMKVKTVSLIKACLFSGTWLDCSAYWYSDVHNFMMGKRNDTERLVKDLVDSQLLDPKKTTLTLDDLEENPFAFIALLRLGAGIRLDSGKFHKPWNAHNLAPVFFQLLHEIPEGDANQLMAELMEQMAPLIGWDLLNKTSASLLWGRSLIDESSKGDFCQFYQRWVKLAYMMLNHGAVCTLTGEEEKTLRTAITQNPDACKSYFGKDADELFLYLEKAAKANSPQPLWANLSVRSSVEQESKEQLEGEAIISQIFELTTPEFSEAVNFEQTMEVVLENYYKVYHPCSVIKALHSGFTLGTKAPLRSFHDCDHVVRTALFTRVFLQLLNEQKVAKPHSVESMSSNEYQQFQELLQLAVLYHDVVAENQPKNQEEIQAALYLLRDRPSQLPDNVFMEVAVALANKNVRDIDGGERAQLREKILSQVPNELIQQVPEESWKQLQARFFQEESSESPLQRWLRMVIRFGDTVDIVRVTGEAGFDWSFLERPECYHQHPDLERQLRPVVKACWNLSAMTGGAAHDSRYAKEYRLREPHKTYEYSGNSFYKPNRNRKHNEVVRRSICAKGNVWDGVRSELLRMAKRQVAYMANMKTAAKDDAKYSNQARYQCIYDERDLDQITLPENLTELELLRLSCGDIDWLSGSMIKEVMRVACHLRATGVAHPLGTLSKDTLRMTENTGAILHSRGLETWVDHKEIAGTPVEILRTRPIVSAPVKQV